MERPTPTPGLVLLAIAVAYGVALLVWGMSAISEYGP
jgi:hypothetical protein